MVMTYLSTDLHTYINISKHMPPPTYILPVVSYMPKSGYGHDNLPWEMTI